MQCKLDSMALNLNEKKNLQVWLKEHELYCPDIKIKCNYSLSFFKEIVKVKCKQCGEKKAL